MDELNSAEQMLADVFPSGGSVDLTTGDPEKDDPVNGEAWGASRTIRARIVRRLLLNSADLPSGGVPAIRVRGARIAGELDLSFSEVLFPLYFEECLFGVRPTLYMARTKVVSFRGSVLPRLTMSSARVDGHLRLENSHIGGTVQLGRVHVAGGLLMNGARITARGGAAIHANHVVVDADVTAQNVIATGRVSLVNARVGGALDLDRAVLSAFGPPALLCDSLAVEGGISGIGMTVNGEVSLRHARLTGPLTLSGAHLRNPGDRALRGTRLTADGGIYLDRGFAAEGTVRLVHSRISRVLALDDATVIDPDGVAVAAAGVVVDGNLQAQGLRVQGMVDLTDAQIANSVDLTGASLTNPGDVALDANRISIGGALKCSDGFASEGVITLTGGRLGGQIYFRGAAKVQNPDGLAFKAWQVTASELFLPRTIRIDGTVDLRHARFGVIRDAPSVWPERVRQDGLIYDALDPLLDARQRLAWLESDPDGYLPHAYEQLASIYRRLGHDSEARTVLLAKQRRRRRTLPGYARVWGYLQDWTVGYGYRPVRAALGLTALLITGAVTFSINKPIPVDPDNRVIYHPLLYTLDVLLPVVDLGQERAFQPAANAQWLTFVLIAAGWILVTTIAAGITRSLSRQ